MKNDNCTLQHAILVLSFKRFDATLIFILPLCKPPKCPRDNIYARQENDPYCQVVIEAKPRPSSPKRFLPFSQLVKQDFYFGCGRAAENNGHTHRHTPACLLFPL